MRILLINPRVDKIAHMPLSILQIAAAIEKEGHKVKILDCLFSQWDTKIIHGYRPDVVGVSYMTLNRNHAKGIIRDIRQINKKIKIITGGIHASFNPEESIQDGADFVVIGDGNQAIVKLLRAIEKKESIAKIGQIPGIAYKEKDKVYITKQSSELEDIDLLPLPAYHLIDMDEYLIPPGYIRSLFLNRVATIYTSRGCPYSCSFCDIPLLNSHKIRYYSLDKVKKHIMLFIDKYACDGIYFADEVFTINRERVIKISDIMKKTGLPWGCQTRVDLVDYGLLEYMHKSGCVQIDYGVESGSDRVLKRMRKGITREKIISTFEATRKANLRSFANIIVGNPEETKEDLDLTVSLLKVIRPNFTLTSFHTPMPRTSDYNWAVQHEIISPDYYKSSDYHFYASSNPKVNSSNETGETIAAYKKKIDNMTFVWNFLSMIRWQNMRFLMKIGYSNILKPKRLYNNVRMSASGWNIYGLFLDMLHNYQEDILETRALKRLTK